MNKNHYTCRTCKEEKPVELFSPSNRTKCKDCCAAYMRQRRADPEFNARRKEFEKIRRQDPAQKQKTKEYNAKYRAANRDEINRKNNEAQAKNPELRKARKRSWYERNQERERQKAKEWREANPEKVVARYKSDHGKAVAKAYRERRVKEDPLYKMKLNLRSRIQLAFKNGSKSKRTQELIGCSWEFLKEYLEEKFLEGMTWENYGFYGWHVDHIKALSTATCKEELEALCHYSNLQPLWAKDNWSKGRW
jgi:hypothetical protein